MREREEYGMNQINIFEFLTSLNDMMVKIQKGPNIVQYSGIFIPFLYVELLVIVVNIDALVLDDVDIVKIIPYFL